MQVLVKSSRTPAEQCLVLWRKLRLSEFSHPEESAWVVVVEMMVWMDFCFKRILFPDKGHPAEIVEIKIFPKK